MGNPADMISQKEKRQILANDRKIMSSYLDHARANVDDDRGGRFGAVGKSATVVGANPISYPQQPPNSPWARDVMPMEPPLGFSVNEMEPVGEVHERQERSAAPSGLDTADATAAAAPAESQDGVAAVSSRPWRRF